MKSFFKSLPLLTLGAIIAAISIEIFLAPNQIIDGGIVGISIMLNYITSVKIGIFTFILNLPFLFSLYIPLKHVRLRYKNRPALSMGET